jgi:hemerythrin-like domain-containing protein
MDIFEALKRENAKLQSILGKLVDTTASQPEVREEYLNQIEKSLTRHRRIEENYLLPVLDAIAYSKPLAENARSEIQTIDNFLRDLKLKDKSAPAFQYGAERLHSEIFTHIEWEQSELLEKVRQMISREQAEMLWQRAEGEIFS